MSGFLVMWRHTMDDIPIGLYQTKEDATIAAETTSFETGYAIAARLDIDASTPVCFCCVAFEDGAPTELFIVPRADDPKL